MTSSSGDPVPSALTSSVGHYENFPVASLLCPPALRPAVMALYRFARTADDLADEGDASPAERLAQLNRYRQALTDCLAGGMDRSLPWPEVFGPLSLAVDQHRLPAQLLHDLISAFEQDVRHTASGHIYASSDELLGYCRLSANPVGRLLLHLYGVDNPDALARSDAICSALQLINFWQDLGEDLARGRHYLPADALLRHGLTMADFCQPEGLNPGHQAKAQALLAELCAHARSLMDTGAPLALDLPGRTGWELRLVVQGGLRILDKIAAAQHQAWRQRPTLGKADLPRLLWRAVRMGFNPSGSAG